MKTHKKLLIAAGAATCIIPIGQAMAGIGFEAGDWKVDISGNVNAFYVGTTCDSAVASTFVNGGLACTGDNSGAVRNGLLPGALVISATTRQDDFDVGVTIGFYPGINSSYLDSGANSGGNPAALGSPGIDARQAFFTFGDASWGSVKLGRDIGLFGRDAILDDMTLLGVGTALSNGAPGNTSLGRIGVGYIYADWEPQITYTTPKYSGFSGSVGIFQPLDSGGYTKHTSPQFQAGVSYAWGDPKSGGMTGKVWVDVVTQQYQLPSNAEVSSTTPTSNNGTAVDGGVKLDYAGFEGVLYAYSGSGVGTTGLYILATSNAGNKRDSDGGYLQASYKVDKVKFGLSYGISELKYGSDESLTNNPDLLKSNSSVVGGVYYALTKNVNLVGEYMVTKAKAQNGNSATEKDFALGGIIFF